MKFIIEYDIFRIFPDLRIGVVLGRGLQNRKNLNELGNLIDNNTKKLLERMGNKPLIDFPNIKSWRETYRQMGLNHNKYIPTAEAFVQQMIKRHTSMENNSVVKACLAVQLLTLLPIGGYDLALVEGDIILRVSKGGELFVPPGKKDVEFTDPGEFVYSDNKTILTRHWNYRSSGRAEITEDSTLVFLSSEAALKDISTQDLIETLYKIVKYESNFCQGTYSTFILDNINPEVELR